MTLDTAPAHEIPAQLPNESSPERVATPSATTQDDQEDVSKIDTQTIEVVIPVYNEQASLGPCVHRLHAYLSYAISNPFVITIANNASVDDTAKVAEDLAELFDEVRVHHLALKGRGRALNQVWSESEADVLVYMDVDLSTDLSGLLPLISPLLSGHSDIAIGSRLARGSRVIRGAKREFISRSYNALLRVSLGVRFTDAQCGFKAMTKAAASQLLPLVQDTEWFFDTELLVIGERAGMRIYEVPVDWVDDPDSRVNIMSTAMGDIKGILRLIKSFTRGQIPLDQIYGALGEDGVLSPVIVAKDPVAPSLFRQVVRFGTIGVLSTISYILIFIGLSPLVGAQGANLAALLITAVGNTAANRRFTFGISGRNRRLVHQGQGVAVFLAALILTSGSLALYHQLGFTNQVAELLVLVVANLCATLFRFVALKHWVFRARS